MYLRITSGRLPLLTLGQDIEYTIAEDKSCVLIRGAKNGHYLETPKLRALKHSLHVALRPELGATYPQILTPIDNEQVLRFRVSETAEELAGLDYHFKVYINPIDFLGGE